MGKPDKAEKAARFSALACCLDEERVGQEEPYEARVSRTVL